MARRRRLRSALLSYNLCQLRRFPPPWTVEAIDGGFKIVDANKQASPMSTATLIHAMPELPTR